MNRCGVTIYYNASRYPSVIPRPKKTAVAAPPCVTAPPLQDPIAKVVARIEEFENTKQQERPPTDVLFHSTSPEFFFTFAETFAIPAFTPDPQHNRYILSTHTLTPFETNRDNEPSSILGRPVFVSANHRLNIQRWDVSFSGTHGNMRIVLYAYNTDTDKVTVVSNLMTDAVKHPHSFHEDGVETKKILQSGTYRFHVGVTTQAGISGVFNVSIQMHLVRDTLQEIKRHFRNIQFDRQ